MNVEDEETKTVRTLSGDALLLGVTVAVAVGLLWPYAAVWARGRNEQSAATLKPVAWEAEKALPEAITSLSPLYQVVGDGDDVTLRIGSGQTVAQRETALLVWLEGEWVVAPLLATEAGYTAYFDGWLPGFVTVAALPADTGSE